MRYTAAEHHAMALDLNRDGPENHFTRARLGHWREAVQSIFEAQIKKKRDDQALGAIESHRAFAS